MEKSEPNPPLLCHRSPEGTVWWLRVGVVSGKKFSAERVRIPLKTHDVGEAIEKRDQIVNALHKQRALSPETIRRAKRTGIIKQD